MIDSNSLMLEATQLTQRIRSWAEVCHRLFRVKCFGANLSFIIRHYSRTYGKGRMERVAKKNTHWVIFFSPFFSSVQFAQMPKSVVPWPMVKREFQAQCAWVSTSNFQIQPACLPLNSPRKCPNDLITTQAFLSSLCQCMTWYSKIYIGKQQDFGGSVGFSSVWFY